MSDYAIFIHRYLKIIRYQPQKFTFLTVRGKTFECGVRNNTVLLLWTPQCPFQRRDRILTLSSSHETGLFQCHTSLKP